MQSEQSARQFQAGVSESEHVGGLLLGLVSQNMVGAVAFLVCATNMRWAGRDLKAELMVSDNGIWCRPVFGQLL